MLKLGTETGSLINYVMSSEVSPEVNVGDPATLLCWTDREPMTVVEVFNHGMYKYFVTQRDDWEIVDGKYKFSRDPNGAKHIWRITKDQGYRQVRKNERGRFVLMGGGVVVGRREKYYDPHF